MEIISPFISIFRYNIEIDFAWISIYRYSKNITENNFGISIISIFEYRYSNPAWKNRTASQSPFWLLLSLTIKIAFTRYRDVEICSSPNSHFNSLHNQNHSNFPFVSPSNHRIFSFMRGVRIFLNCNRINLCQNCSLALYPFTIGAAIVFRCWPTLSSTGLHTVCL